MPGDYECIFNFQILVFRWSSFVFKLILFVVIFVHSSSWSLSIFHHVDSKFCASFFNPQLVFFAFSIFIHFHINLFAFSFSFWMWHSFLFFSLFSMHFYHFSILGSFSLFWCISNKITWNNHFSSTDPQTCTTSTIRFLKYKHWVEWLVYSLQFTVFSIYNLPRK